MFETQINAYGREKLKNLARFEKLDNYPIIYKWHDRHPNDPSRYIVYFAVPDDRGIVFIIPAKWCKNVMLVPDPETIAIELNEAAIKLLNFPSDQLYPIIHIWHDENRKETDKQKKKYNIWFEILSHEREPFIVQSTWGKLHILDKGGDPMYNFIST